MGYIFLAPFSQQMCSKTLFWIYIIDELINQLINQHAGRGMQTRNCTLSFFIFILFFLLFSSMLLFHFTYQGSLSKYFIEDFSFLSMILGYFIEFGVFYFCQRFSIVNSAIVKISKLAIFCIHITGAS